MHSFTSSSSLIVWPHAVNTPGEWSMCVYVFLSVHERATSEMEFKILWLPIQCVRWDTVVIPEEKKSPDRSKGELETILW